MFILDCYTAYTYHDECKEVNNIFNSIYLFDFIDIYI